MLGAGRTIAAFAGALRGIVVAMMAAFFSPSMHAALAQDAPPKPLNVAVYLGMPYAQADEAGTFSGLSVDLWHRVAQTAGLSYRLTPVSQMSDALQGVREKRYDLAIGAITVTPAREKLVDFSHPTHPSGAAVAVRAVSGVGSAFNVVSSSLWDLMPLVLGLLALLVALGSAIWWLERRTEASPTKVVSVGEGMYWAAVTMATVGYGDKTPKTGYGRALAVVWMFASILLTSMFTATIIAKLTAAEIGQKLTSPSDLQNSRLAAVRDASGAEYLSQNGLAFSAFATLPEALAALQRGEADAVVHSRGALEYNVAQGFSDDISLVSGVLLRTHMAFALPEDDSRKEVLDHAIMQVLEAGGAGAETAASVSAR